MTQAHCKTYRKTFAMMTLAVNSSLILALSVMLLWGITVGIALTHLFAHSKEFEIWQQR